MSLYRKDDYSRPSTARRSDKGCMPTPCPSFHSGETSFFTSRQSRPFFLKDQLAIAKKQIPVLYLPKPITLHFHEAEKVKKAKLIQAMEAHRDNVRTVRMFDGTLTHPQGLTKKEVQRLNSASKTNRFHSTTRELTPSVLSSDSGLYPLKSMEDINADRPETEENRNELQRQVQSQLQRFDDFMERVQSGVYEEEDNPLTVRNQDYHLIKMLFQMELVDNCGAIREIRRLGDDVITARLAVMRERFGVRRLNREEFFYQLSQLLQPTKVSRAEAELLFEMCDSNQSGGVDESEFIQGINMGLHSKNRSVAAYGRRLMDARTAGGTVITMWETDLLFKSIIEVCEWRYPSIQQDVNHVLEKLQPMMHHSQIPLIFFRAAIGETDVLSLALREMSTDASLPPKTPIPPSPSPDKEIVALAKAYAPKQLVQPQRTIKVPKPPAHKDQKSEGKIPSPPPSPTDSNAPGTLNSITMSVVDYRHPRFRADECMLEDQEKKGDPPEHNHPVWSLKNGSVWCVTDISEPMIMN